jgi:hypothetical protein
MNSLKISLLVFIFSINVHTQNPSWEYIGDEFPGDSVDQNFTDAYLYSPWGMWWISSGYYQEIYRATDFGVNWETQNIQSIISTINYNEINGNMVACAYEGKIYIATDIFSEWELYDSINAKIQDACITYTTNSYDWTVYICGDTGAVWSLTESGFTDLNIGLDINFKKVSSRLINNVWLCGDSMVYYYDGNSFTEKLASPEKLNSIYFKYPTHVWSVGENGYIVYSSDNGDNWTVQNNPDLLDRSLNDIFFSQLYNWGVGWAVGDQGLILKTTNFGNTWEIEAEGVTDNDLNRIDFCHWADYWGGSFGPGIIVGEHKAVLLYPIVVSVEDKPISPGRFLLSQNYPNPFNSTTAIQYSIQQRGNVLLKVYDILGNEVKTLVNEEKEQGVYTINFDANNLPSGMYLYRIQADSFIDTKKMILLK